MGLGGDAEVLVDSLFEEQYFKFFETGNSGDAFRKVR